MSGNFVMLAMLWYKLWQHKVEKECSDLCVPTCTDRSVMQIIWYYCHCDRMAERSKALV